MEHWEHNNLANLPLMLVVGIIVLLIKGLRNIYIFLEGSFKGDK